jgi:lipoyl(octanoyl) transferase
VDDVTQLTYVRAGTVPYDTAWAEQRRLHAARVAGEGPDTVLLLEHPPVYTAGRRTNTFERPVDGSPVVDVDRGGRITWHGPGQLVGYPILRLPAPLDVIAHVRNLEEALIRTAAELGVTAVRIEGRSGVWVPSDSTRPDRKLSAIGVRVSQGVTMHGWGLNCNSDLSWFDRIVPCGISDAGVTSLSRELERDVTVDEVVPVVERHLADVLAVASYTVSDATLLNA